MFRIFNAVIVFTIFSILFVGSIPGRAVASNNNQEQGFWQPLSVTPDLFPPTTSIPFKEVRTSADSVYHAYNYLTYEHGTTIRVRDINQDGWEDVIFSTESYHIRVWLQNPQCHKLEEWITIPTELIPMDFEIADLNGDGKLEIVAVGMEYTDGQPGILQIFSPFSEGYSSAGSLYRIEPFPRKIAIGDLNNDKKPDILVSSERALELLTQQPLGNFLKKSINNPVFPYGEEPNDIVIGDFNKDGLDDVALQVIHRSNGIIVYYQANGNLLPGISLPWPYINSNPTLYADSMTSGDITGDGLSDIIAVVDQNIPNSKVVIYEQLSGGSFSSPKTYDTYQVPSSPEIADMNKDGRNDLVLINNGFGSLTLHYQTLDGKLGEKIVVEIGSTSFGGWPLADRLSIGDVNGDGDPDVVYLGVRVGIMVVTQDAEPSCPTNKPPRAPAPSFLYGVIDSIDADEAVTTDIDGDGLDDVITLVNSVARSYETYVQVVKQNIDGTFRLGKQISMETYDVLSGLSAGDLNNDGLVDISAVHPYYGDHPGVYLVIQKADGSYEKRIGFGNIPLPKQTYIADWNGDSRNDLAVFGSNGINIFAQQADATLAEPIIYSQGELGTTSNCDITDWNGDGRMDIVAYWRDDQKPFDKPVRVLLQKQEGGFELLPAVRYDLTDWIFAGDLNSDKKPDIVLPRSLNYPEARLGLVYQEPDGTLAESVILSDPGLDSPGSIVISDFNFDDLNDLLVFNTGGFRTTVFTQNPQHTFDAPYYYYDIKTWNDDSGHAVAKIDKDKDRKPDVIVYVTKDHRIVFLKPFGSEKIFLPIIKR